MCCTRRPKIRIMEFTHDLYDPRIIHARTTRKEELTLTKCVVPEKRRCKCPLYSDGKGHFFTLTRDKLGEVFDRFGPGKRIHGRHNHNGKRGNEYPLMREFGSWNCHTIVLLTFQGPRPIGDDGVPFEGDHKNGCVTDYSNDNLEWVHPDENRWRSFHVLRVLRAKGINPALYTGTQMDKWFDMFRLLESYFTVLPHWQTFTAEDYLRWFDMPFDEFKTMWSKFPKPDPTFDQNEWDMTHHCEI